jgi:hypothetical protein
VCGLAALVLSAIAWKRGNELIKPVSESLAEKLKYIGLPDHNKNIGYQHEVGRTTMLIHSMLGTWVFCERPTDLSFHPHCLQVIRDLNFLQQELQEPLGWERVLRAVWAATIGGLIMMLCNALHYLWGCGRCEDHLSRNARRAVGKAVAAKDRRTAGANQAGGQNPSAADPNLSKPEPPESKLPPGPRVVVFVDDLDRVEPKKVAHILEAVNLVLAASGFTVVLGMVSAEGVRTGETCNQHAM